MRVLHTKSQHFYHSRACFEQGWTKWDETLSIHPSDLCLQRWTGAVRSSSHPEIPLSVVATRVQRQKKSKSINCPALTCSCPRIKASFNIWETIFPLPGLFPVGYQILLDTQFKGANTDLIPVLQVWWILRWADMLCRASVFCWPFPLLGVLQLSVLFCDRKEGWEGNEEGGTIPLHNSCPKQLLLLKNCCRMWVQWVLVNLHKGDEVPSQPMPAVSLAVIKQLVPYFNLDESGFIFHAVVVIVLLWYTEYSFTTWYLLPLNTFVHCRRVTSGWPK